MQIIDGVFQNEGMGKNSQGGTEVMARRVEGLGKKLLKEFQLVVSRIEHELDPRRDTVRKRRLFQLPAGGSRRGAAMGTASTGPAPELWDGGGVRKEVDRLLLSKYSPAGVVVDKNLASMDKIVVINRIKPHTDFRGEIESGLAALRRSAELSPSWPESWTALARGLEAAGRTDEARAALERAERSKTTSPWSGKGR